MDNAEKSSLFHERAKDSGDKLRTYIVSLSSATTGLLFVNLTSNTAELTDTQKITVALSITLFSATILLVLFELYLNARRFYSIAIQHEQEYPDWAHCNKLAKQRLWAIKCYYLTMLLGIIVTLVYMIMRIA